MPPEQQQRLSLKLYKRTPTCGLTWIDDYLLVTHYLSTEPNKYAPGLVLTRDNGLCRSLLTWQNPFAPGQQLAEKYTSQYNQITSEGTIITSVAEVNDIEATLGVLPTGQVSEEGLGLE